jgi:hypothetical protein
LKRLLGRGPKQRCSGVRITAADRILIVRTDNALFQRGGYAVQLLSDLWREEGISVDVTDRLLEPTGADVLVLPHLDITVTPRKQAEVFERCKHVINRSVTDISKSLVSRHRISSPNGYEGPVIVKTDRNFGGEPEAKAAARRGRLKRRMVALSRRLPWTISGLIGPDGYRIYDHPRLVPRPVWYNPLLVVEKFLPEREGELYCLRQYVFLGPCEISTRAMGPDPVVKSSNVVRREILDETPPPVREYRAQLGFDFGKFDYVVHGGEPVIFDVNRTPTYDRANKAGSPSSLIAKLAPGILPFLGKS